jgi:hypothetical protein
MSPEVRLEARVRPDSYLRALKSTIALELATLRNNLRALDAGSLSEHAAAPRPGSVIHFSITVSPERAAAATSAACRAAFLGLVRSFIEYLDRLVALRRLHGNDIPVPKDVTTPEELSRFVQSTYDSKYSEVSRDTKLSNPKKVAEFASLDARTAGIANQLFAVRRCIEHHGSVPVETLGIELVKHTILVGDKEVTHFPFDAGGKQLSIRFDRVTRSYPAGRPIELTEEDVELVYFTIDYLLGPKLLQAVTSIE